MLITLKLKGQIRGGKNQMQVTKDGRHYPNKSFSEWSKSAILELKSQRNFPRISDPNLIWAFSYTPADNRRRDVTAILDAVFHCLERANIIEDDSIIKNIYFRTFAKDKKKSGLTITIGNYA